MLEILLDNPDKTAESMATSLGVTKRTIERNLKKITGKGYSGPERIEEDWKVDCN